MNKYQGDPKKAAASEVKSAKTRGPGGARGKRKLIGSQDKTKDDPFQARAARDSRNKFDKEKIHKPMQKQEKKQANKHQAERENQKPQAEVEGIALKNSRQKRNTTNIGGQCPEKFRTK